MTTKSFVAKVSRIKNKKDKEYYINRINIPSEISKELGIKHNDYLFLKAKKAEWYHMLDWSTMNKTWDRLPSAVQKSIIEDGLIEETVEQPETKDREVKSISISTGTSFNQHNIGSG